MSEHLLSLAAGVLPEFPPDAIAAAAAAAGFRATGIWFDADRWTNETTQRVRSELESGALTALDIEVIWLRSGRTVTDSARRLIATGGALGARNVLIVSANADPVETRLQFEQLCELATNAGMRAVLEFLMISAVKSLREALAIVQDVGHPAGGVLVDALHLQRCGARPSDLVGIDASLLPYAQLCDGPITVDQPSYETYLEDAIDGRSAPGEGALPLRELMSSLPSGIAFSLEVRSRRYRESFPDATMRAAAVLAQTRRFLGVRTPAT